MHDDGDGSSTGAGGTPISSRPPAPSIDHPLGAADLARFRAGDEHLFDAITRSLIPRLRGVARRHLRDADDAEDCVQDTLCRLHVARATYRGDAPVAAWAVAICRAIAVRQYRHGATARGAEARCVVWTASEVALESEAVAAALERQMRDDAVADALIALPVRQWAVTVLRVQLEKSVRDTAECLRCAAGTVKATQHQAAAALRKRLGKIVRAD